MTLFRRPGDASILVGGDYFLRRAFHEDDIGVADDIRIMDARHFWRMRSALSCHELAARSVKIEYRDISRSAIANAGRAFTLAFVLFARMIEILRR